MRICDIISKKKNGEELTKEEISFFVDGYTKGSLPDYQISALLMAICLKGMTDSEITHLTFCMANSGDVLDLSRFNELSADKHSTGGVGDKTTLIVAPIVAAAGLKVAKMSGRGLGFTGGTIDKLESICSYNINPSKEDFLNQVDKIGVSVISQSGNLTPADKKLYALRDVTATVDSLPLIASSIMSKKIAAGAKNIVLDVKTGSGAFMKTQQDAILLAEKMVKIGNDCNRNTAAVVSNMNEPLGNAIGNSLEVIEVINTLKEPVSNDLTELCLTLSSLMISLSLRISFDTAKQKAEEILYSKKAYDKFKEWIKAQGGNTELIENTSLFPKAEYSLDILAENEGYISMVDCEQMGVAASVLGAGRTDKDAAIDYTAGIIVNKKIGDYLKRGDILATLYTNDKPSLEKAKELCQNAICISTKPPIKSPQIIEIIK